VYHKFGSTGMHPDKSECRLSVCLKTTYTSEIPLFIMVSED